MAQHYNVVVSHEGADGKTRYTRVGAMFENRRDTGEPWYKLQLDFPVAAKELLAFPPRADGSPPDEDSAGQAPDAGRQPA